MARDFKYKLQRDSTSFQVVLEEMMDLYNKSLQSYVEKMLKNVENIAHITKSAFETIHQNANKTIFEQVMGNELIILSIKNNYSNFFL